MRNRNVVVTLTPDEALVLFEWLQRTAKTTNNFETLIEDQAEQRALWNIACLLERVLAEPFSPRYSGLLDAARGRLRDTDTGPRGSSS